MDENLKKLSTESRNPNSMHLDECSPLEVIQIMNAEDQKVALAVQKKLPEIAQAVEILIQQLKRSNSVVICYLLYRLVY